MTEIKNIVGTLLSRRQVLTRITYKPQTNLLRKIKPCMAIMFTTKHKVLGFLRQINKNNKVTDTFNRFNKFLSLIEAVIYWITGKK